jgi:hypothetical protein
VNCGGQKEVQDSENACDETKESMWRVSGNRKIVRSDDPWQLGLQPAVAMWAERTDPGIRGSSSDATAAALRPGRREEDDYSSVIVTRRAVPCLQQVE